MTGQAGGGLLTVSGSLSEPGTVVVGGGTPYVTGSSSLGFTSVVPVVTGSNAIQISATDASGNGVTQTLQVNVSGGTPASQLSYDANGNLTYDGNLTYRWDAANRLVEIDYPGGGSSQFAYDGFGRRVRITESGTNGVTVKNLIWDQSQIAEARNQANAITNWYFAEGAQVSGTNFYYTRDHLGSIREMTDGTGSIKARYNYDPFGRASQSISVVSSDFGFTGLYYHQPSGLNLAVYRDYAPPLGRWLSRDPIDERGGFNLYTFIANAGGVFDGTVERIGWNDHWVLASVVRLYHGDVNGWYALDLDSGQISGPFKDTEISIDRRFSNITTVDPATLFQ